MANRSLFSVASAIAVMSLVPAAYAQDVEPEAPRPAAERSAADGAFLLLTLNARVGSQQAFVTSLGGYDGARSSAIVEGSTEITLFGPVSIRAGAQYTDVVNTLRPTFGVHVQALRQERHGIDASAAVVYKPEGLTEGEGEIEAIVALGRREGRLNLIGNLVYGQDPEGNDRDSELRLATLYGFTNRLYAGMDTRFRVSLGNQQRDPTKRLLEADADVMVGPTASYAIGPIALIGQTGVSALKLGNWQVGSMALGGIGAAF